MVRGNICYRISLKHVSSFPHLGIVEYRLSSVTNIRQEFFPTDRFPFPLVGSCQMLRVICYSLTLSLFVHSKLWRGTLSWVGWQHKIPSDTFEVWSRDSFVHVEKVRRSTTNIFMQFLPRVTYQSFTKINRIAIIAAATRLGNVIMMPDYLDKIRL